jgi:hypothetical protein
LFFFFLLLSTYSHLLFAFCHYKLAENLRSSLIFTLKGPKCTHPRFDFKALMKMSSKVEAWCQTRLTD